MSIKISVVIPVYNKEKFIGKCIDSVLGQSYKNLEVIIINDGSTDDSDKIIEEYARLDTRILHIQIENHGRSYARNLGIEKATGEYVSFIDADDTIPSDYYQKLIDYSDASHNEMLVCEMQIISSNGKKRIASQIGNARVTVDKKYISNYISTNGGLLGTSSCNKLFLLKTIRDSNIRYPNMLIGEDFIFVVENLKHTNEVVMTNNTYYCYYMHQESTMHSFDDKYFEGLYELINFFSNQKGQYKCCFAAANIKNYFKIIIAKYYSASSIKNKYDEIKKVVNDSNCAKTVESTNEDSLSKNYKIVYNLLKHKNILGLMLLSNLYISKNR